MQTIYFGLQCDQTFFDGIEKFRLGSRVLGPIGLLRLLENFTGRSGYPDDVEFLRIEAYRKAVRAVVAVSPACFFSASFRINEFATAKSLLAYRDELLLAGFDFLLKPEMPARLKQFCQIEASVKATMPIGYTERFVQLLADLPLFDLPIHSVSIVEPFELLPTYFRRLFGCLLELGIQVEQHLSPPIDKSALLALQNNLLGKPMIHCELDDSVSVVKADSESIAADWLSKWLQHNKRSSSLILIPDHKRLLDVAFHNEGIPMMGINTSSNARPSLQLLKLVTVFFWKPMDCEKIISFLLLPLKPIDDDIAFRLAAEIAQKPGNNVESWKKVVAQYAAEGDYQNNFEVFSKLFLQRKFDRGEAVPKLEVLKLYKFIHNWISGLKHKQSDSSVKMLRDTARRLIELLEAMDDVEFSFSNLHHVINAIVDPVSVRVESPEMGSLPVVFKPAQILEPVDFLICWNFVNDEQQVGFDFWSSEEQLYFKDHQIAINGLDLEIRLKFWQTIQPFVYCRDKLLVVIPASIDGKASVEHPLWPYLQATFSNLEQKTFDLSNLAVDLGFASPISTKGIAHKAHGALRSQLVLSNDFSAPSRALESPSSLEKFIYYPHQWFFEYQLQLKKSSVVSINDLFTIKGNVAHRLIEQFYKSHVNLSDFSSWYATNFQLLLEAEGASLLAYGLEPERRSFENNLKEGMLRLINGLARNGWSVVENEMQVKGIVNGVEMQGIIDLVAQRGNELLIVDVKYSGFAKRNSLVKNNEDIQLFFYQQLLQNSRQTSVSTSYFIVDQGKFVTKFPEILNEAIVVTYKTSLEEMLQLQSTQIMQSIDWRKNQLLNNTLELRFKGTVQQLEADYRDVPMLQYLEMKSASDTYDNYLTLLSNNVVK